MHGAVFNVPGSVWIIIWIFAGSDTWIYPVDNWISCPFNFERKQNLSVQFPGASSLTRGLSPVVRLRRALLALSEMQNLADPHYGDIFPAGGVRRGEHIAFHLPRRRNPSSGKPDLSQSGMINAIENLHQLSTVRAWRAFGHCCK